MKKSSDSDMTEKTSEVLHTGRGQPSDGTGQLEPDQQPVEELKDGGYGWVLIGCQFVVNGMSWGINSSYGVYLSYYLDNDYFHGATHLQYAFIGGLSMSTAFLSAPFHTWGMNHLGFRKVFFVSAVAMSGALLAASFAKQIWHLFLTQGVLFGIGMSGMFVVSLNIPPPWFHKRRALALSIAAGGSGLGGFMWSKIISVMIREVSLQWALRLTAIVSLVFNLTAGALLKEKKGIQRQSFHPFDLELLCTNKGFWGILQWTVFSILGYVALVFSLSSYAHDIGISQDDASWLTSILNIGMFVGRPVVGYTSDYMGRVNISCSCTFAVGLLCLLFWQFAHSFAAMAVFSFIVGIIAGTFWATVASATAEVVGLHHLNAALSMVWIIAVIPGTFSEPIALELLQTSTRGLVCYVGGCYIMASLGMLWAKIWKQNQLGVSHRYKVFMKT